MYVLPMERQFQPHQLLKIDLQHFSNKATLWYQSIVDIYNLNNLPSSQKWHRRIFPSTFWSISFQDHLLCEGAREEKNSFVIQTMQFNWIHVSNLYTL